MVHINNGRLIGCYAEYGPLFGSGSDFGIADNCNTSTNHCTFPTVTTPKAPINTQETNRLIEFSQEQLMGRCKVYRIRSI